MLQLVAINIDIIDISSSSKISDTNKMVSASPTKITPSVVMVPMVIIVTFLELVPLALAEIPLVTINIDMTGSWTIELTDIHDTTN